MAADEGMELGAGDEEEIRAANKSLADQKKDEGNQLYKTKNYREAITRYSEAINLCPSTASFYGNRSACHMMLAQYAHALDDSRRAVQLDDAFVKGYARIAKCCLVLGDAVSARQAIERASAAEPGTRALDGEAATLQLLEKFQADAIAAFKQKDFRKALYCVDRALSVATASHSLKLTRAECLAYLGRYQEAQEIANDTLRNQFTSTIGLNADAVYIRGLCLYYEDNMDKAFTHFKQVLTLAPDHEKARETYKKAKALRLKKEAGNDAFKSGKLADAYKLYSEALDIDPVNKLTNAKLHFNRATVAAKLGKLKESVSDCSKAIELDENYTKAILRRAKSYMELEDFEEAVRDYETVHRTDRTNSEYRKLLQQAKLELKKSKRKDYYKILGVGKQANEEEIKKAYRKRALVHHPDRHAGASDDEKKEHERKFKEVGEAYGILSDAKKRSRYDNGHDLDDEVGCGGGGGGGGGHFAHDIDPNHIFQAFFGGGSGMPGGMHFSTSGGGGGMPGGGAGGMPGGFQFQFG